ncbi:protein FAM180B isoform X1 [Takifugu rubripes]|uniref:protein FAM180B isoform X1 n=2 Tax=Takifugu rubripes TaxID=31033 RepID=UPI0005D2A2DE|nr:protein FAM180B-like isoform X1 [Takifugu rubripes]|eukprot:XP_011605717.1 PREDICTED: protein FAM180B-like [Takifugu rubripes]
MLMKTELNVYFLATLFLFQQMLQVLSTRHVAARPTVTWGKQSDAKLMFEILLGGLELDQDNNVLLLDQELASMRSGRAFLSQINDNIPRTPSSMMQMASMLHSQRSRSLPPPQFDRVVLSLVYSALQGQQQDGEERQAWGEVLLQLANVTVHELRGSYLFSYA